MQKQKGQTLIETLVAAFILAMGITAALGLASYSLNATTQIKQQVIAMGLAREGVEVIKNMRDTNWLKGTLTANCRDFTTGANNALCYNSWLTGTGGGYDISSPGASANYYLSLNTSPTQQRIWSITRVTGNQERYGLNFNPSNVTTGFYSATGGTVASGTSGFGRMITLEEDNSFSPFTNAENWGPRLKVTSSVWWNGKRCVASEIPPADGRCKVVLQTYLTNWKNY